MEETSPIKNKATSRVIDSLHSEIDSLNNQIEKLKLANKTFKKNYDLAAKKNELYLDQLANAKHENDMANALLKRKERRVADLEEQCNDLNSSNETLSFNMKNMKIRYENLQESSATSMAQYERLKIAYEVLQASQVEYKKHYEREVNKLSESLKDLQNEHLTQFNSLNDDIVINDKDICTLLEGLNNKKKTIDNINATKIKTVLDLLSKLATATKVHGQESKVILKNNFECIKYLFEKYPDLPANLSEKYSTEVDIDRIMNDSFESFSNSSFDEEATLISSPVLNGEATRGNKNRGDNSISLKKQKHRSILEMLETGEVAFSGDFKKVNTSTSKRDQPLGSRIPSSSGSKFGPEKNKARSNKGSRNSSAQSNNKGSRNTSTQSNNKGSRNMSTQSSNKGSRNTSKTNRRSMYANNAGEENAEILTESN